MLTTPERTGQNPFRSGLRFSGAGSGDNITDSNAHETIIPCRSIYDCCANAGGWAICIAIPKIQN